MTIAIVIAIIILIVAVFYFRKETPASIEAKIDSLIEKANTMTYGTISCRVVGIYYRGEKALDALRYADDDEFVTLIAEPENEYDSNAVKVILDDVHIGYIPREKSFDVSQALKYLSYARITDKEGIDDDPFVMIEIVFNTPTGLTDEEMNYIYDHAPERVKELTDPTWVIE